jgi:hypothetical protein
MERRDPGDLNVREFYVSVVDSPRIHNRGVELAKQRGAAGAIATECTEGRESRGFTALSTIGS